MIQTGENRNTKRKTCPSSTLITADLHNFTSGIPCTKFLTKWNNFKMTDNITQLYSNDMSKQRTNNGMWILRNNH